MKKICALVVTYNRKDYLMKLLSNLLNQTYPVSKLIIFDNNSSDSTPDILLENNYIDEIKEGQLASKTIGNTEVLYFRNLENSGGSGGFHDGIKLALQQNCDYIWTMDDDVLPEKDCLENLIGTLSNNVRLALPTRTDKNYEDYAVVGLNMSNPFLYKISTRKKEIKNDDIEGNSVNVVDMPFEGPIFDVSLIKEIGLPKKDLFIIFDDSEYALRASKVTEIRYVKNAVLHKQIIPVKQPERLMGWKDYYGWRNQYWFDRTYGENIFVKKLRPIFNHLDLCARAIVKRKWTNLKVLNKAYYDGTRGILGKTINPGHKF